MIKLKKIIEMGNAISWHIQGRESHEDPLTNPDIMDEKVVEQPDINFATKKIPKSYGPYSVLADYYLSTMDIQELKKLIKNFRNLDFYDNYKAYMVTYNNKKFIIASIPESTNIVGSSDLPGLGDYFIKDELGWRIPENDEYTLIGNKLGKIL